MLTNPRQICRIIFGEETLMFDLSHQEFSGAATWGQLFEVRSLRDTAAAMANCGHLLARQLRQNGTEYRWQLQESS